MQTISRRSKSPFPIPAESWEKNASSARNFLCRHYSRCLDTCIDHDWEGFSCAECAAFSLMDLKPWEWAQDAHNCAMLMFSITSGSQCGGGTDCAFDAAVLEVSGFVLNEEGAA